MPSVPTIPTGSPQREDSTSGRAARYARSSSTRRSALRPRRPWPVRGALGRPALGGDQPARGQTQPSLSRPFARQTLRALDELRIKRGAWTRRCRSSCVGGTSSVELNHSDLAAPPAGFRVDSNDSRILAVALNLRAEGRNVTLVTKDMPLRVKAASVGVTSDEYLVHPAVDIGRTWTEQVRTVRRCRRPSTLLYSGEPSSRWRTRTTSPRSPSCRATRARSCTWPGIGARAGWTADKRFASCAVTARRSVCTDARPSNGWRSTCSRSRRRHRLPRWSGRHRASPCCRVCAGLEAVLERRAHKRVAGVWPLYAVGGRDLGYLPGNENEKMSPVGAGGVRHPRRAGHRRRDGTSCSTAACSKCCR